MANEKAWLDGFRNNHLKLIIFTTEQCNFRCKYCYENFSQGRMGTNVVDGIVNLITNSAPRLDHLDLSFFGGEPLLNQTAIRNIGLLAKQVSRSNGVKVSGSITTNGYLLLPEVFNELCGLGINNYQITLDGESDFHNQYRPLVNGKPSFSVVQRNIEQMLHSSGVFKLLLRFNVSEENKQSVSNYLVRYAPFFIDDPRVKLHFHSIFNPDREGVSSGIRPAIDKTISDLYLMAAEMGYRINQLDKSGQVCYASKMNSWVVRVDGKVQKCTVALDNEVNFVGFLNSDGKLSIDDEKNKKWVFASSKSCPRLVVGM